MKQFNDLSKEEKIELVNAFLDGMPIEFFDGKRWCAVTNNESINFYAYMIYRAVGLKDEFTNWDILPKEYKWIARDEDGRAFAYPNKPTLDTSFWCDKETLFNVLPKVDRFLCYKKGTVNWKDSLIERPTEGE